MNLTILDAFTANPGDLSWDGLEKLASCTFHTRTAASEVVERAQDCEAVLTNKTVLNAEMLQALPKLRYIGVLATGYNVVDIEEARKLGITVTNIPGYSTPSVAQTVLALLLELTHHAGHHSQAVRERRWSSSQDFCFWDYPLMELSGKTLGIVGYGSIGEGVARIALAMDMKVLANRRTWRSEPIAGVQKATMDECFAQSDVVSLHCPLTDDTKHLINASRIAQMKRSAFLINTARGPLVNEQDLADALAAGTLAGAGLDVLSAEPPAADNPLLSAPNCIITPHIAWASKEARSRLIDAATANLAAWIAGQPRNVVS
ncbi:MAG: D-2-hydroxyacid dehydrogenase [Chthoniobacteraceae bacterium]